MSYGLVYVCDAQKTAMAATDEFSVDPAIASVLSELESILSLQEEQRMTLKVFLGGKNVFAFFLTECESLIYQVAPLVIWFVDLIGRS